MSIGYLRIALEWALRSPESENQTRTVEVLLGYGANSAYEDENGSVLEHGAVYARGATVRGQTYKFLMRQVASMESGSI